MFRSILSQARTAITSPAIKSSHYSKLAPRKYPEINEVKLVGTTIAESFVLPSGSKAVTIKTGETHHQVFLNNNLEANQRIHVSGRLISYPFNVDKKPMVRTIVQSNRMFVLEEKNDSEDINHVELAGNIARDVLIQDSQCILTIATHFNRKPTTENTSESGTNYHNIHVRDEKLCDFVRNNLQTRDRVIVRGQLNRTRFVNDDGKREYSGFVVAENIEKIAKRNQSNKENEIDHEINN